MKSLITLAALLALTGCSEPMETKPVSFDTATARCLAYGGLQSVRTTFYLFKTARVEAACKQGVNISWAVQP